MDPAERTERVRAYLEGEFVPTGSQPPVENQVANALTYIAYHAGQIDKSLREINESLKKLAAQP